MGKIKRSGYASDRGFSNKRSTFKSNHAVKHQQSDTVFFESERSYNGLYPRSYKIKPIKEQIERLVEIFNLSAMTKNKALRFAQLSSGSFDGMEGYFAFLNWHKLYSNYGQACCDVWKKLESMQPRSGFKLESHFDDNSVFINSIKIRPETLLALNCLSQQQNNCDILLCQGQFGAKNIGCTQIPNGQYQHHWGMEFNLHFIAIINMLMTHPCRFSPNNSLYVSSAGDSFKWKPDGVDLTPALTNNIVCVGLTSYHYHLILPNNYGIPTGAY